MCIVLDEILPGIFWHRAGQANDLMELLMGFVVVVSIGFVCPHEAGLSMFTEYHIGDGIEDLSVPLLGIMQSFLGTLACDDFSSQRAIDRQWCHACDDAPLARNTPAKPGVRRRRSP
jgi:hypothetical protein